MSDEHTRKVGERVREERNRRGGGNKVGGKDKGKVEVLELRATERVRVVLRNRRVWGSPGDDPQRQLRHVARATPITPRGTGNATAMVV